MDELILKKSEQLWIKVLNTQGIFGEPYSQRIDFSKSKVTLTTDDFLFLLEHLAREAGIDLDKFASSLTGEEDDRDFAVIFALRTVFEVEKYYIEHPYADSFYDIPKTFLIVFGAALIGIAINRASDLPIIVSGSVTGVGSLLISILANRYNGNTTNAKVDWLEEFVLKTIELAGELTYAELKKETNIYGETLKDVLKGLEKKELIEKHISWVDKKNTTYKLK